MRLTTRDHDRSTGGKTYVYPVLSRRAGGLSIGINLNPNRACNWRCIYCQVPGLTFGNAPAIDLEVLRQELNDLLAAVVEGDFLEQQLPEGARRLNDIAFSGDGEPTSSRQFGEALQLVVEARQRWKLTAKTVLITNGSLLHKDWVRPHLAALQAAQGEVWFKLDRATESGLASVNSSKDLERQLRNLELVAELCPTWVQACFFARSGQGPDEAEIGAWLAALAARVAAGVPLRGVLLYGLARPSHQPEAPELSALGAGELEALGERVRELGLECRVSP